MSTNPKWNSVVIPPRVTERAHTRWVPEGKCWISTYSTASHGYAQIGWQNGDERHVVLAHRASWEHVNGRVPLGMTLDHKPECLNQRCVNPEHLRILSNADNAGKRGRDHPLGFCGNGHPESERKVYVISGKKGKLLCHPCRLESQRRHRVKKKKLAEQE